MSTLPIQLATCDVVRRRVHERLGREPLALLQAEAALLERDQDVVVAVGRGDDRDRRVVLGRRAHHRGAADVDLLDALVGRGAGHHRLGERVEVRDHEVERRDPQLLELGDVRRQPAVGEDPGVHLRVQRLDPAVEALGEPGEVLDLGDRQAEVGDQLRRPARRDQLDVGLVQSPDEVLETRLVVDRDQGAPDRDPVLAERSLAHGPIRTFLSVMEKPSRAIRPTVSTSIRRSATLIRSCSESDLVVVLHGYDGLGDDRPGVDTLVDHEQRGTGDLDAVGERVRRPRRTGEGGAQGRVRVHDAARETGEEGQGRRAS